MNLYGSKKIYYLPYLLGKGPDHGYVKGNENVVNKGSVDLVQTCASLQANYQPMRLTLFVTYVCFLLLTFRVSTLAQIRTKSKEKYEYLLYLPKEYDATKGKYPLVIYLHGSSQTGSDLSKLKAYGPPYMVDKGHDYNFIIVAPQCPEGKVWSTDNWFDALYKELTTKYRIDKKRIYLTGISMGGYGTWQTAVEHPKIFAAIAPLCGGCDDSTQVCRIKRVPVWTIHGSADNVIPIAETERLVNRLEQCGGEVKFTRLENEGHGIQYYYEKNDIYDWLLTKQRK